MRLLVRADDAGLCDAVNRAIVESVEQGIARNVSVMVPTPRFAGAAALLRELSGVAIGLHTTLNSEWHSPRWGPVLPAGRVRSLVDSEGHFLPAPAALEARGGLDVDEAVAEVEAQLQRAREAGLVVSYLDEHMGVGRLPGLRAALTGLAHREGLVYESDARVSRLSWDATSADPVAELATRIRTADDGTYLLLTHPGIDTDELRAITGIGFDNPGEVSRARDTDRRALVGTSVRQACDGQRVELIRYTDLAPPEGTDRPQPA